MNTGTILAVMVVVAYLGFEAVAAYKASHRMEPAYIHNLLVETHNAVEICNSDVSALRERFERTLSRATNAFERSLLDITPNAKPEEIVSQIIEQRSQAQSRVTQSLAEAGCDSRQMKDHLIRYRIYANKSR